jgi:NTE family protein
MTNVGPEIATDYPPIARRVNGVFKGGGAKGLVYAGALHEVRARGIWFESVAGASAGAITATLVAAGYQPDQILRWAPHALLTVEKNLVSWLTTPERAVFKTGALRDWIEARLCDRFPYVQAEPMTFRQLQDLGLGIELNVVAMDLARNEPILFNWRTTPNFSVAEAVIASSAIPVVMPSRRVLIRRPGKANQVHRIVDGGTWANYPAFVYRDPSLRSYFGLPALEEPNTLGFVIESNVYGPDLEWLSARRHAGEPPEGWTWPPPAPTVASGAAETVASVSMRRTRFDRGSARRLGFVGALLTWAALRWLILALIALGVWSLVSNWGRVVLAGNPLDLPSAYQRAGTVLLFVAVMVVFSLGIALVLATIRFGPEAVDAGLPSLLAATSASLGVARWVGHAETDRVIRLSAPLGISVVNFKANTDLQALAVMVAAHQTAEQLDLMFANGRHTSTPTLQGPTRGHRDAQNLYLAYLQKGQKFDKDPSPSGALFLVLFWAVLLVSFVWVVPSVESIVISLIIGIPTVWYVIVLLLRGRMYNQAMQADDPAPPPPLRRLVLGFTLLGPGFILLNNPQSFDEGEVIRTGGLVLGSIYEFGAGISLVAGVGCILSGLSRISARVAARRYRREVGNVAVE